MFILIKCIYGAHACTDVTGFGILGHATNLAENQLAKVDFEITHLPIINKMTEVAEKLPYFRLLEGYSAETSGNSPPLLNLTNNRRTFNSYS